MRCRNLRGALTFTRCRSYLSSNAASTAIRTNGYLQNRYARQDRPNRRPLGPGTILAGTILNKDSGQFCLKPMRLTPIQGLAGGNAFGILRGKGGRMLIAWPVSTPSIWHDLSVQKGVVDVASYAIAVVFSVLWIGGLRFLWRQSGWLPRIVYLAGGALAVPFSFSDHFQPLAVLGLVAVLAARMLPAHGWHRQPGEG